jgi:hypothetical protein
MDSVVIAAIIGAVATVTAALITVLAVRRTSGSSTEDAGQHAGESNRDQLQESTTTRPPTSELRRYRNVGYSSAIFRTDRGDFLVYKDKLAFEGDNRRFAINFKDITSIEIRGALLEIKTRARRYGFKKGTFKESTPEFLAAALTSLVESHQDTGYLNSFVEANRRYADLKQQYENGDMSLPEFRLLLEQIMVQDEEGRWWAKHVVTGEWHYYNGDVWVKATPPD